MTGAQRGGERKRSERFSWCEHRWRGDGKIIESRLSHRRTKEIFHRPTNFLAKWPCIKIAEEKRKIEREREREDGKTKTKIATTGEVETQCSGNRKRELKTRRSINMMIIITIIGGIPVCRTINDPRLSPANENYRNYEIEIRLNQMSLDEFLNFQYFSCFRIIL